MERFLKDCHLPDRARSCASPLIEKISPRNVDDIRLTWQWSLTRQCNSYLAVQVEEKRIEVFVEGVLDKDDALPSISQNEELLRHERKSLERALHHRA